MKELPIYEDVVVGGGPSAYGAVLAMSHSGRRPVIIAPTGTWTGPSVVPGASPRSRLARKTRFGSSDMYLYPDLPDNRFELTGSLPISAYPGGLSSVWGANLQVFSRRDLTSWGTGAAGMWDAYAAILREMPHVGENDNLTSRFPWPVPFPGRQHTSNRLQTALDSARERPATNTLLGLARNATSPLDQGCISCGMCLEGCPENVIFDASMALSRLFRREPLTQVDGVVTRVRRTSEGFSLDVMKRLDQEIEVVRARRVILAAGSIATTLLLQRSELIPENVVLDDTQVFYVPIISFKRPDAVSSRYALAQMFATNATNISAQEKDDLAFHLSIYETDPSYRERASSIIGSAASFIPAKVFKHVLAAIGFVPPGNSGKILIVRSGEGSIVRTLPGLNLEVTVQSILKSARPDLSAVGLHLVPRLAKIAEVGASFHCGNLTEHGMSLIDVATGTLRSGGPDLHIVDGAALPEVPTGPVTLTLMANAYRIVSGLE